jgi:hypothetical protein
MTTTTAIEKLTALFNDNEELFNWTIEALDSYNGYLGDDRYYEMYMLDEFYTETNPTELLARAFYGYDDMYKDENGKHPEAFNPNREYFYYNGYGNLVSSDIIDYSTHHDDYFIQAVIDNAYNCDFPDEVMEIIDAIDDTEETDETAAEKLH